MPGLAFFSLLFAAATYSENSRAASSPTDAFSFDSVDSIQRLRRAHDQVWSKPSIQNLLNENGHHSLSVSQRLGDSDKGIETTKFQHYYQGFEVIGSMSFHHLTRNGSRVQDEISRFDLSVQPSLKPAEAVAVAKNYAGDLPLHETPTVKILPKQGESSARLVYWVTLDAQGERTGGEVLVDAHSGQVIAKLPDHDTLVPIQVLSAKKQGIVFLPQIQRTFLGLGRPVITGCKIVSLANGSTQVLSSAGQCQTEIQSARHCQVLGPDGVPLTMRLGSCAVAADQNYSHPAADATSSRAVENSLKVLEYYQSRHQRNGFDGRGSPLVSVVHVGYRLDNAMWHKTLKTMFYGDGDGVATGDFTRAIDIAGHEMTHGVTGETAKLLPMDESGALAEAYSDFFGKMIANENDWTLGKGIALDPSHTEGVRDLANPGRIQAQVLNRDGQSVRIPYPSHVRNKHKTPGTCDESNDGCWIHVNSTIPGHASYLVTQAIGKERAESLYYAVLTQYLTPNTDFRKASSATLMACNDLGMGTETCSRVREAFRQVGISEAPQR